MESEVMWVTCLGVRFGRRERYGLLFISGLSVLVSIVLMNRHDLIFCAVFLAPLLLFVIWTIVRARRWERLQGEAAQRSKAIIESVKDDRERLEEARAVSREHLQVSKELLAEIKALREDLKSK